jgi:hypothetical protein
MMPACLGVFGLRDGLSVDQGAQEQDPGGTEQDPVMRQHERASSLAYCTTMTYEGGEIW